VLFACLLASAPLNHHDVACHLKSATHCTACMSVPVPGGSASSHAEIHPLSMGGCIQLPAFMRPVVVLVSDAGGRSPPLA
jgi:hypothetical protein